MCNLCSQGNEFVVCTAIAPALRKMLGYGSYLIMFNRLNHEVVKNSNTVISVLVGSVVVFFFFLTVAVHVILIQRITLCEKKNCQHQGSIHGDITRAMERVGLASK